MPLTFAHPAVILPFSRKSQYVNFLAMVLGSMSPDFEYFLRGRPYGEIGHTFWGFLVFNLPIVMIVYLIYQACIHGTLFRHLPSALQDTYSPKTISTRFLKICVFFYSALFGMLTHVVWDSFTHAGGFMVRNFSILTYRVPVFDFAIPVFKFLQHGGTLVGILAIISYLYIRTAKYGRSRDTEPKQKWLYWGQIALLSLLLFGLWYLIDAVSIESFGIIIVRIINSALISLLLVSISVHHFYERKQNRRSSQVRA